MYTPLKIILWFSISKLTCSYSYFDHFFQGQVPLFRFAEAALPPKLFEKTYAHLPVPRTTIPQIAMPATTEREPYHKLESREIDPEILDQLNAELQDGTHPTTQALVPVGLRYLKVLGAGTQGTAVLFEMDAEDGTTRKIVAKYDTGEEADEDDEEPGLTAEKDNMLVSQSRQDT